MSSSRLGEKVWPGALDSSRPACTWYSGGSSLPNSISQVVFVEGMRTPKCRVMGRNLSRRGGETILATVPLVCYLRRSQLHGRTTRMNDQMTLAERADALEHRMMQELDCII